MVGAHADALALGGGDAHLTVRICLTCSYHEVRVVAKIKRSCAHDGMLARELAWWSQVKTTDGALTSPAWRARQTRQAPDAGPVRVVSTSVHSWSSVVE